MAETALIIDNEIDVSSAVGVELRNAGIRLLVATDGEEGLGLAKDNQPEVVIVAYKMREMNGIDFIKKLRLIPETEDIPVILLTSENMTVSEGATKSFGIAGWLQMPICPKKLLRMTQKI